MANLISSGKLEAVVVYSDGWIVKRRSMDTANAFDDLGKRYQEFVEFLAAFLPADPGSENLIPTTYYQ